MKRCCLPLLIALGFAISACSGDSRPFEAVYTSRNDVTINYQGRDYRLNRFQPGGNLPFKYAFEGDGDLNLVVDGQEYEIESPYDVDNKKKKKKTSVKKKTK